MNTPALLDQSLLSSSVHPIDNTSIDKYISSTPSSLPDDDILNDVLYDQHKSLAEKMIKQLEIEYACTSWNLKLLCRAATLAYLSILENKQLIKESLEYQQKLAAGHTCGKNNIFYSDINKHHAYFGCCACNRAKIETEKYKTLTKELDRAYKHFYTALQELRLMKQTPLQVTVKANTAVIGNQQAVQVNSHE